MGYYGHVMRKDSVVVWRTILYEDNVRGRRSVDRQRRRWIEHVTEWTEIQMNEAERITADRHRRH